jgi:predicted RNA-binding protein with PUA-like domain
LRQAALILPSIALAISTLRKKPRHKGWVKRIVPESERFFDNPYKTAWGRRRSTMAKQYWLMKSEPGAYSIDDLKSAPGGTDHWDGVRNYQARNFMRDEMKPGDRVLFYHSGKNPSVVGTAAVSQKGYPDHTARDPKSDHYDPKSTEENPIWYMVDIRFEQKFPRPVPLSEMRKTRGLEKMMLLKKGMRLSIQPVLREEFDIVVSMGAG